MLAGAAGAVTVHATTEIRVSGPPNRPSPYQVVPQSVPQGRVGRGRRGPKPCPAKRRRSESNRRIEVLQYTRSPCVRVYPTPFRFTGPTQCSVRLRLAAFRCPGLCPSCAPLGRPQLDPPTLPAQDAFATGRREKRQRCSPGPAGPPRRPKPCAGGVIRRRGSDLRCRNLNDGEHGVVRRKGCGVRSSYGGHILEPCAGRRIDHAE